MITADQIRAARSLLNVRQADLAKAAKVSLATLNNIERGVGDPRASTIERVQAALERSGLSFANDAVSEGVSLARVERPRAYETYLASERILQLLLPGSLLRVRGIHFFARAGAEDAGADYRICLLIEGKVRAILFDQVDLHMASAPRAAEVCGIFLAAFTYHRDALHFTNAMLTDTTHAETIDAVGRVRAAPWRRLEHPAQFCMVFDDWRRMLLDFGARAGHPISDVDRICGEPPD